MEKTRRIWNYIFLIIVTVCCLSLTSCGSDDEDNNNSSNDPQKALIGTWQTKFIDNDRIWYSSYTFKKDGTYLYKDWLEGEERNPDITTGIWYVDEDYICFTDDDEGNSHIYQYKYMLNGKTLLLNDMIYTKK